MNDTFNPQRRVVRRPLKSLDFSAFVHAERGPILRVKRHFSAAQRLPLASALVDTGGQGEVLAVGRAFDYHSAQQIALLEGLERFHGLRDRTGRPGIRGSLAILRQQGTVVSPVELGLYRDEQYARPDFPCRAFQEEEALDWVFGWNARNSQEVLLPREFVFYGDLPARPLVLESSNGCSLGSTLEEAVFFGLLEVLERDAALRWWSSPSWYELKAEDLLRGESYSVAQIIVEKGYLLRFFNATTAFPGVMVVACSATAGQPAVLLGCGYHPDLSQATLRALTELSSAVGWATEWTPQEQERAATLGAEPWAARSLADHPLLYAVNASALQQRLSSAVMSVSPSSRTGDTLAHLLAALPAQVQVYAAEQSSPALVKAGLRCVKVLTSGLLPMYYGAQLSRVAPGESCPPPAPHPFS